MIVYENIIYEFSVKFDCGCNMIINLSYYNDPISGDETSSLATGFLCLKHQSKEEFIQENLDKIVEHILVEEQINIRELAVNDLIYTKDLDFYIEMVNQDKEFSNININI